ncbi:glycosyltransferase [Polaribacter sp. L3A8]|uniref:glycosyltransferase n=1 Tax=Polaribacter sp. L3A8 TaxID=2686361 RepID=UPI00131D0AD5|nr:glycosyltransferase [Polaribacter sp. L3A8]
MKFTIITHALHKSKNQRFYAYEPYVREMNLWLQSVSETRIVAPISQEEISAIEVTYNTQNITVERIPAFNVLSLKTKISSIFKIPFILIQIIKTCLWADHIHLRCPGNVGLLGCFVLILFPSKPKTVKYAGNWDPESKNQPFSYRVQKWIVSNTFLTKNCKVLVYGEWKNQSKNIIPFFTASYSKKEITEISPRNLDGKINFIFVGGLTEGKQPMLSVKVIEELSKTKKNIHLDIFGDGAERKYLEGYIKEKNLATYVTLHGNVKKDVVKGAFKKAHFLLFISKSEGWPKVVAEAMFWGVLPITSKVSCVPYMIGDGTRGALVVSNVDSILLVINAYLKKEKKYETQSKEAMKWSQEFTLEKFEFEIGKLLND